MTPLPPLRIGIARCWRERSDIYMLAERLVRAEILALLVFIYFVIDVFSLSERKIKSVCIAQASSIPSSSRRDACAMQTLPIIEV